MHDAELRCGNSVITLQCSKTKITCLNERTLFLGQAPSRVLETHAQVGTQAPHRTERVQFVARAKQVNGVTVKIWNQSATGAIWDSGMRNRNATKEERKVVGVEGVETSKTAFRSEICLTDPATSKLESRTQFIVGSPGLTAPVPNLSIHIG